MSSRSSLVGRLPKPVKRIGRAAKRILWSARLGIRPAVREPSGPWPEPPVVDRPQGALDPTWTGDEATPPREYDLALFEALNAEYASNPVAPASPDYSYDGLADRSRKRIENLNRRLNLQHKVVLEVGCGSGMEAWYVANRYDADAWGIDVLERRAWPELRSERVHLVAGDMSDSSDILPSATFDRVISNTVWEHIEHPRAALEHVYRVLKPGGIAWIRANLHRGPTASHRAREIAFPFPHLLFSDAVIAEGLRRAGKTARGAAWVNRLTYEQYETYLREIGFSIRSVHFDRYPLDEAFYARFEDVLGRYPKRDLERGFFTVIVSKPRVRRPRITR
jgi:SAM-dependent methyltransferase